MNMVLLQCIYCIYIYTLCVCVRILTYDMGYMTNMNQSYDIEACLKMVGKPPHGNGVFQLGNA